VAILRAGHDIPVHQPPIPGVGADCEDVVVVTITDAEQILGVARTTLYRWIRDGFVTAEQITPGASASTKRCGIGSDPRFPRAGSVSMRPPRHLALPDKPCCTRSNAANYKPSTSIADAAKGSVSGSNPTSMDCSTHPDKRRAQC
jgi:predicted DNA-binding transcriptional regulator AlpA